MPTLDSHTTDQDRQLWNFHQVSLRPHYETAHPRYNIILQRILKTRKTGRALEIGFGDGYLLEQLSRRGITSTGIDLADDNVRVTKELFTKKGLPIELRAANINSLPFPDSSFDILVASEVVEHLDDDTLARGLSEISRVLTPSGMVVITVPADELLEENVVFCPNCGSTFHRWGHKQTFSKTRLQELFKGYRHVEVVKIPMLVMPSAPLVEKIKYWIRSFVCKFYDRPFVGNYLIKALK
jgi:2-polyprenyl-3-methyl-5-hydroxy-6-metoxy-1,4-benzoquinol methylase